jgi:branched-chain amino acid transport system substrate-binding protein
VVILVVAGAYVALVPGSSATPACPSTGGPTFTSSTINVGYITELSGESVSNGYAARIGAELAVNQTNGAGGVDGKTVNLVVMDDQTTPQMAQQRAQALDEQYGVLALTGPTDLPDAMGVSSYAEACGVPFVDTTVSSAELVPPGSNWTVSVEPDSVQWGAAVAKYVSEVIPGAKIALMTQNAEQQNEMAAGVKWYVNTYRNESVVFDEEYANAQFAWATAAAAARFSGANAVVVSWVSTVGFSESNVVTALLSAGFQQSQIFVVDATNQVTDLGVNGTGIQGATLFDGAITQGYPNASAFAKELAPYTDGELNSPLYCGVCPGEVGPIYYYSYLGTLMMINAIRSALSSGQPLTREGFMSAMKHQSVEDAFGNPVTIESSGTSVGSYYIVAVGQLNSTQSTYPLTIIKSIRFAPGTVPAYEIAKSA